MMKKFMALLLAVIMTLSLAACGNTPGTESAPGSQSTPDTSSSAAPSEVNKVINIGITTDPQVVNPLNDNNGTAF